ncbi:MAG: acyl carrier protein [Clostridiales bacterium]|jgi:acyl carrier protein|nr:acyl carrier protein [Clostridiales bacterium]
MEDKSMVFENVSKMIAEQLKVDTAKVTREARLVEDLGADSANVMVLIMDLEDHYNMQVDDNAITSLKTVGDVVEYIEQRQQ